VSDSRQDVFQYAYRGSESVSLHAMRLDSAVE